MDNNAPILVQIIMWLLTGAILFTILAPLAGEVDSFLERRKSNQKRPR